MPPPLPPRPHKSKAPPLPPKSQKAKQAQKKFVKKEVKKEVKKDVKKEIKKEAKKEVKTLNSRFSNLKKPSNQSKKKMSSNPLNHLVGDMVVAKRGHQLVKSAGIFGSGNNYRGRLSAQNITGASPHYRLQMQEFLGPIMKNASSSMSASYVACLANPAVHQCRIPDSYARPTALYLSKKIMTLTVAPQTNNGVQGRFAFCASPVLGNIDNPLSFQDAFCDPVQLSNGNQSAIDWTSTAPYLTQVSGVSNVDPRIDPNIQTLTQGDFGYYRGTSGATGVTNLLPFGTAALTEDQASNNLNVQYSTNLGQSTFKIPQGQYIVTLILTGATIVGLAQFTPTTATDVTVTLLNFNATATNYWVQYQVTATRTATNLRVTTTAGSAPTAGVISVVPTMFDNTTIDTDNGFVEKIRPVAMCALVTYTGTTLQNGGNIAIALVPGDTKQSKFVTNQAEEPGNLRTWDNIANLNANLIEVVLKMVHIAIGFQSLIKTWNFILHQR